MSAKKTIIEFRRGPADGLFCVYHDSSTPVLGGTTRYLVAGSAYVVERPSDPTWERACSSRYRPHALSSYGGVDVLIVVWSPAPASTANSHSS